MAKAAKAAAKITKLAALDTTESASTTEPAGAARREQKETSQLI
jgi:hypothetical protein